MTEKVLLGSKKLSSNIFGSTLYKAITVASNLLLVRVCVNFMGEEKYGTWLTVLSFLTWFSVIEFGISNSFRNKLTIYFTENDSVSGRNSISDLYKLLSLIYILCASILVVISVVFSIDHYFLPANYKVSDFGFALKLSTVFYMLFFVTFGLNTILLSIHQAKRTYFISAVQSLTILLGISAFSFFDLEPTFTLIFLWFSTVPLLIWFFSNIIVFRKTLKYYAPNLKSVFNFKIYNLPKFNWDFLIIQLCTVVILSTDNLIIINRLSGTEVLKYNIAFKYFNILLVVFNLVLIPYWAVFAEAASLKRTRWIKNNIKKLIRYWILILFGAAVLYLTSKYAYKLWIGKDVKIPNLLSLFMGLSIVLTAWNSIFAYFLNAVTEIKIQMYLLIFSAVFNIPLSFYLISKFQTKGVIIATCVALLPLAIVLPIQYSRILKKMT